MSAILRQRERVNGQHGHTVSLSFVSLVARGALSAPYCHLPFHQLALSSVAPSSSLSTMAMAACSACARVCVTPLATTSLYRTNTVDDVPPRYGQLGERISPQFDLVPIVIFMNSHVCSSVAKMLCPQRTSFSAGDVLVGNKQLVVQLECLKTWLAALV